MSREYDNRQGGADAQQAEREGEGGEQVRLMRMAAMQRRWKKRQAAANPAQAAEAAAYKESMRRKVEHVKTTVAVAGQLFLKAMVSDLGKGEPSDGAGQFVQLILDMVFSELTGGLSKLLFKIAKDVAKAEAEAAWDQGVSAASRVWKETEQSEAALKRATGFAKSGMKSAMKGQHPGGEEALIDAIVNASNAAARQFVDRASAVVASIPNEEAAADFRLLNETKKAPGVHEAKMSDSEEEGDVEKGIEDQYLEASGAPLTGHAEAERLAVNMLRLYRAERINYFVGGERANKVQEAITDPSVGAIKKAEQETGLDGEVRADRRQRERASQVGHAMGEFDK